jgi:maltose alpha-D-glucosyltransferase/alpha-amylase
VLLSNNDFVIIDFEGEPARTFDERRAKRSPLRDVAGMLRSFDYARWSALRRVAQEPSDLYASLVDGRGLLGLYEIDKLLYELRYELANRPDWVQIPLRGLLEAADVR